MQLLVRLHTVSHYCVARRLLRPVSLILDSFIRVVFSAVIPVRATIAPNVHFGHNGLGVVINRRVRIDANCLIGAHVVLGGNGKSDGAPTVLRDAKILSGARVIGPVLIGAGATVGAGAVVLTDVPEGCLAVGVPARIISGGFS